MKIGKGRGGSAGGGSMKLGKPAKNNSKKTLYIVATIIITALLIVWVYSMGRKAEETVPVIMTKQSIYKNQMVTENMLMQYDMLKGEFEKFTTVKSDGTKTRRILLWEERDKIEHWYAAYPIQANTYAEYRSFIKSRTDNSDSVLYSFPGKEIVPLEIGTDELKTFKTFLQPGDRVNIVAIYTEEENVDQDDGFGNITKVKVQTTKVENAFTSIMLADLLNGSGESILDIYADYNLKTTYQQAALDSSTAFQDSVEPKTLLLALTPEEKSRYYYLLSKSNIQFKMALPQRID